MLQHYTFFYLSSSTLYNHLLYGSETWTLDNESNKRLESFEMWIYRRLLKVSWKEKQSNVEILRRVGKDRELLNNIRRRQMRFFGHVLRHRGIEHLAIGGFVDGKRARGRQRMTYVTGLRQATTSLTTNVTYVREADDRPTWRQIIGNVQASTRHT